MAIVKLYNLARMSTATTGTGTITLGSAATVDGVLFLSFSAAGVSDGEVVMYGIADPAGNSEVGYGTYTSAGTALTRNPITSTNSNNAIDLGGSAQVFICPAAQNMMTGAVHPQGRLTLTAATPVLVSTVSAATTIYYTPYAGNMVPIYNGALFTNMQLPADLTNSTSASAVGSAGPAAVTTNSNYDLFVWNNAGTLTLTRGPLWTSSTARGSGAGTTELTRVNGIYLNANTITNGPAASRGTYVGTARSNGTSTIDYIFGAQASGGTAGVIGVWNAYNRVQVSMFVSDSAANHTYTSAVVRPYANSSTMRVSMVRGLNEDGTSAVFQANVLGDSVASATCNVRIGLDSTSSSAGASSISQLDNGSKGSFGVSLASVFSGIVGLGFHFIQALEQSDGNSNTFYGGGYNGLTVNSMA